MQPFFSIVLPCCNVGKYLRECLESIQRQSFKNWECLAVIEESTDDTEQIVREFAEGDPRFRVFKQARSGSVAVPRNTGMDNALGEYIVFCDGDDSLFKDSLGKTARRIAERPGADIYACAIWEYMDGGDYIRTIDNFQLPNVPVELSGHDAVLLLYNYWQDPSPMLQENVWRRDFLNTHHLRCIPGLVYQDSEFFPRALYLAQRIVPLSELLYRYRRHNASITLRPCEPGFRHRHWAVILKSLFAFHAREAAKPGFDCRIARCWGRAWVQWIIGSWFYNCKRFPRSMRIETLRAVFADGFRDFDLLVQVMPFSKRVVAWWIKLFVRCPSMAWVSELFFRFYFVLAEWKKARPKLHEHGRP